MLNARSKIDRTKILMTNGSLTLSLPNATLVEFTVHCQTRDYSRNLKAQLLSILNSYKGRNSLFCISKCSGDIIISYLQVNAIFCTRMDFTNMFVRSLDFVESINIENMSMGMTYRAY